MFRKLVSNISFSPALVGQLGFYAKRLRKEESTRRIGLIFTALALVVQYFAVFAPPESANASSGNDMISGGATSISKVLSAYDRNLNNIKDFYTSLGITRAEIAQMKTGSINSKKTPVYSYGMNSRFSSSQGEGSYKVKNASGSTTTFYYRPLRLSDTKTYTIANGSTYKYFYGYSEKFGWFGILQLCGNFISKQKPPKPACPAGTTGTYPNCATPPKCTIPGKTNLLASDANCKEDAYTTCDSLSIARFSRTSYQLTAKATTGNGASVSKYVYTISKDGKVIDTIESPTSKLIDTQAYTQNGAGTYTVKVTVHSSQGTVTSASCAKEFTVEPPARCEYNQQLLASDPECQPCEGDDSLWIRDAKCSAHSIKTKSATNLSQGNADATKIAAKASDSITYTLKIENTGKKSEEVQFVEKLDDILEYAEVTNNGGGALDKDKKTLTWPTVTLAAGESQTRTFTIRLASKIPSAPTGASDQTSYDCRIVNTFGNSVTIDVNCPVAKTVEQTVTQLPKTGPAENMLFAGIIFAIVAYFYVRSRQLKTEVRLIRRDINAGTI